MSANITNLYYSEKNIGSTLKISKRQFIWEFNLNGSSQRIELLDSRLSRKKRVFKNGINILDTTEEGNFLHNFEIDGHPCVIIQYGDKIELRIDNQSFTHLYNLQKNKQLFAGEKGPTSNIYVAKPYNSYGSSDQNDNKNNENTIYKVNKPEEENKPKLFNFEIKKDTGNKSHGFNSKFKFGQNKGQSSFNSNQNNFNNNQNNFNNIQNNNNQNNNNQINNKGNIDLLGFQDQQPNLNNNDNNNINNNNNNLLDFSNNNNNSNINNQNIQNPQKNGDDIFDLFGNNNNQNQNNNNNNNQNTNNNNNPYNNIFLSISDGTNQKPNFDQNNLGFLNLNNNINNNNLNNDITNNIINNNNSNNLQNQQINQNSNSWNQNQQNSGGIDLLNF